MIVGFWVDAVVDEAKDVVDSCLAEVEALFSCESLIVLLVQ